MDGSFPYVEASLACFVEATTSSVQCGKYRIQHEKGYNFLLAFSAFFVYF